METISYQEPELRQLKAELAEILKERTIEHPEFGLCRRSDLTSEQWTDIIARENVRLNRASEIMVKNPSYRQVREGYAVAGWSDRHDYFRNRYGVFATLEEARDCLNELKQNEKWRIPTVIVKMTWYLNRYHNPFEFLESPVYRLGFAHSQALVAKDKMGVRGGLSWDRMLNGCGGNGRNYTY